MLDSFIIIFPVSFLKAVKNKENQILTVMTMETNPYISMWIWHYAMEQPFLFMEDTNVHREKKSVSAAEKYNNFTPGILMDTLEHLGSWHGLQAQSSGLFIIYRLEIIHHT